MLAEQSADLTVAKLAVWTAVRKAQLSADKTAA